MLKSRKYGNSCRRVIAREYIFASQKFFFFFKLQLNCSRYFQRKPDFLYRNYYTIMVLTRNHRHLQVTLN